MIRLVRRFFLAGLVLGVAALSACTSLHRTSPVTPANGDGAAVQQWQGKLAVKVLEEPAKAFSADFELQGTAQSGSLLLTSFLGTTLAQMEWSPQGARMVRADSYDVQHFDNLDAMASQVLGVALPVADFFEWLQGRATPSAAWQVNLNNWAQGRISAIHAGTPRALLTVVLQP